MITKFWPYHQLAIEAIVVKHGSGTASIGLDRFYIWAKKSHPTVMVLIV